ncbi:hypothetical protein [Niabella hibiscisoli]|nr:hypothetical protein [Niabella hibiscisoli]MCH5716038.1 hypothetical protein [Niabella hibiscisoli]
MNHTMISFLTNEQTPERLQEALKALKQNGAKPAHPKKISFCLFWAFLF